MVCGRAPMLINMLSKTRENGSHISCIFAQTRGSLPLLPFQFVIY